MSSAIWDLWCKHIVNSIFWFLLTHGNFRQELSSALRCTASTHLREDEAFFKIFIYIERAYGASMCPLRWLAFGA